MIVVSVLLVLVLLFVMVRRKFRSKVRGAVLAAVPIDTGVRSAWRVPGRKPHRGF